MTTSNLKSFILSLPRPIAIIGMGISGQASFALLCELGLPPSDLIRFDQKLSADCRVIADLVAKLPKTLVVSPGVPLSTPWIVSLAQTGTKITSELSLAASLLDQETVIGITGSLGKSTTISILGEMLKIEDPLSFVGGNLGIPLAQYSLEVLRGRRRARFLALELSSYQLENIDHLRLSLGAITYFSPNHLERYSDLNAYYQAKMRLFSLGATEIVLNENGGDLVPYIQQQGIFATTDSAQKRFSTTQSKYSVTSQYDGTLTKKFDLKSSLLIGNHNLDNLAMALKLGELLQLKSSAFEAAFRFKGLRHRIEYLGCKEGVHYINDSKATTMDSVLSAVEASLQKFSHATRLYVLLGGRDKNLPWENLKRLTSYGDNREEKITPLVFGECRERIAQVFPQAMRFKHLHEALIFSRSISRPGDIVLLSPGGTSLDEFSSFEERGEFFRRFFIEDNSSSTATN